MIEDDLARVASSSEASGSSDRGALYSGKAARVSMRGRSLPSLVLAVFLRLVRELAVLSPSPALPPRPSSRSASFSAPFDLHTVSLSGLIVRTRLFPSAHECALLYDEERTHGDFILSRYPL